MKRKKSVQQNLLYRLRYPLALASIGVAGLLMIVWNFWALPNGLTPYETVSVNGSKHVSLTNMIMHPADSASDMIEAPWRALQLASLSLVGVNGIGVRLPAVILGLGLVVVLMLLARKLYGRGASMTAGVFAVLSGSIIQYSHSGTSHVMGLLIAATVVLIGYYLLDLKTGGSTKPVHQKTLAIPLAVLMGVMMYLPGGFYFNLAVIIGVLIHPTTRLLVLGDNFIKIGGGLTFLVASLPLLISLVAGLMFNQHVIGTYLFGVQIPSLASLVSFGAGLVGFDWARDSISQPMVTIAGLGLALVGLCYLFGRHARSSVRTYLLGILTAVTVLLAIFKPEAAYLFYLPIFLLLVTGVYFLMVYWYGLFPRNPYARAFALLPMCALVASVGVIDAGQYFTKFNYAPAVANALDNSVIKLTEFIEKDKNRGIYLIVDHDRWSLYQSLVGKKVKVIDAQSITSGGVKFDGVKKVILATEAVKVDDLINRTEFRGKTVKLTGVISDWQSHPAHTVAVYSL